MHKRSSFWKPFGSQRVNESQKLLKSAEKHFYPISSLFWAKLSWIKSFLVRSETLGPLVNTLTGDDKYSRHNRENLPLPIPIQLSKKWLLQFYCISGIWAPWLSISEVIDFEIHGYYSNILKVLFLKTLRQSTC